jgi:uncharacterized protein
MKEVIISQLKKLEQEHQISILFACESGSRGWGFHSPDSDYDVRFVYRNRKDWYLGIEDRKDFIDFQKDKLLDMVGYDLRKMLKLFRGSNAKIFEWIQSPVMYRSDEGFLAHLQDLMPAYYSPKAGLHHYLGLVRNTVAHHLQGERVRLKKYFYALRPLLAACWIKKFNQCPPMEFGALRMMVDDCAVNERIDGLLQQKAVAGEGFEIVPDPFLQHFILETIKECEAYAKELSHRETDARSLNLLFQKTTGLL